MAVRIASVVLPQEKRVEIGLTYIYGIGLTRSQKILTKLRISPDVKVKDLGDRDVTDISDEIKKIVVEGDLRRQVKANIKRLKDISSYRGIRHVKHLPCRGQQTKTNARTLRGKRVAVAGKKGI